MPLKIKKMTKADWTPDVQADANALSRKMADLSNERGVPLSSIDAAEAADLLWGKGNFSPEHPVFELFGLIGEAFTPPAEEAQVQS